MQDRVFTYNDIALMSAQDKGDEIRFRKFSASTHAEWACLIEDAIDHLSIMFSEVAHQMKDRSEDGLTTDVVLGLRNMGFRATHDEDLGGHCDVVVRGPNNFLWAGEAKIHDAYDWLISGYRQIIDRYTTGNPGQDTGGLIIYVKVANTKQVMERWRAHFEQNFPDVVVSSCERSPLALVSISTHPRSGLPFRLRHVPVSLFHAPTDQEGKRPRRKSE